MKIQKHILIYAFLIIVLISSSTNGSDYPPWISNSEDARVLENATQLMWKNMSVSDGIPKPTSDAEAFEQFCNVTAQLGVETDINAWEVVSVPGKMSLPKVSIQPGFWQASSLGIVIPQASLDQNANCMTYHSYWYLALRALPDRVFHLLAVDAARADVRTSDLVRLSAALGYYLTKETGGATMVGHPNKADWQALYNSQNPCYRMIAFEYYDTVGLTPDELLSIYTAGLMNSCSYVEMRIIYGIIKNRDFRPEVKALLQNYIASNPSDNDGTGIPEWQEGRPFITPKDAALAALNAIGN